MARLNPPYLGSQAITVLRLSLTMLSNVVQLSDLYGRFMAYDTLAPPQGGAQDTSTPGVDLTNHLGGVDLTNQPLSGN